MEHRREEPALGWRERNRHRARERDGAPERSGRRRRAGLSGPSIGRCGGGGEK
ncbi:hypothetical protein FH972_009819 [Carpinus fangiana]|uniref:Uncharacterized protein n=1 Tax=Carpinus fangiana TaxID=176857 RepID=A0A660KNC3_9ROSI|nr:hypothetical protein FH972_009819 [Carpinus fangiana]